MEGMEFLMEYGWAILVILAAIGAIAYFGYYPGANTTATYEFEDGTRDKCIMHCAYNNCRFDHCESGKEYINEINVKRLEDD